MLYCFCNTERNITTFLHCHIPGCDVRNLFALTAVFERSHIEVITAESSREALEILNNDKKIDIVLMDIMMPEMDGYETIQMIRKEPRNKNLPIIAVTAKTMIGDRQKCISSGASDYITKPVKNRSVIIFNAGLVN